MNELSAIDFLLSLIGLRKKAKQDEPCIELRTRTETIPRSGMRRILIEFGTDTTVSDFSAEYVVDTSDRRCNRPKASIPQQPLYASRPIEVEALILKLNAVQAMNRMELEIAIAVTYRYQLTTGEKREHTRRVLLKRGEDKFRVGSFGQISSSAFRAGRLAI